MKHLIIFSILILFGCSSKPDSEKKKVDDSEVIDLDNWICEREKKEALELLKKDSIQFILINKFPRFKKQLKELLTNSNIQLELIGSMHGEGFCLKELMDSVINIRFGIDFKKNIEDKADSLFLEINRGSTFSTEQLDNRPILGTNPDTNGQAEIIKKLNSKISTQDSIKFIPNIVNSPYFVVRFKVKKNGTSKNAIIVERNSTENYKNLEKLIINEINGLNEWLPGKIRNENVDSTVEIAIAIMKK